MLIALPPTTPQFFIVTTLLHHYEKRKLYHHTAKFFSGFALGNNSIYVVAFVNEIIFNITLLVDYGLATRRYYLFNKKLQNSCVSENILMFFHLSNKKLIFHSEKVLRKKIFEKQ